MKALFSAITMIALVVVGLAVNTAHAQIPGSELQQFQPRYDYVTPATEAPTTQVSNAPAASRVRELPIAIDGNYRIIGDGVAKYVTGTNTTRVSAWLMSDNNVHLFVHSNGYSGLKIVEGQLKTVQFTTDGGKSYSFPLREQLGQYIPNQTKDGHLRAILANVQAVAEKPQPQQPQQQPQAQPSSASQTAQATRPQPQPEPLP